MAKTLIGNIKGKDGRGISKIEKTATTGVVDTYTITYTDGTKSTYEVKNSDNVAIQRQIAPSASIESSTTASQAYTAGDYVVVGGTLRKVTSSIAKGSTIGASNSTATTVTGEIETVCNSVSHAVRSTNSNIVVDTCVQVGKAVFMKGHMLANTTGWINGEFAGNPKPIADVGISFCRPADKSIWPEGTLAYNNKVWILSNTASSAALNWSVMYITA